MMEFNNPFLTDDEDDETTIEGDKAMNDWDNGNHEGDWNNEQHNNEVASAEEVAQAVNVEFEVPADIEWLSVPEISRLLGVAPNTARRFIRADGVEVFKVGRQVRVRKTDFEGIVRRRMSAL